MYNIQWENVIMFIDEHETSLCNNIKSIGIIILGMSMYIRDCSLILSVDTMLDSAIYPLITFCTRILRENVIYTN